MPDISVIHGGQNTVMNACLSGTPIVGVGMHPEQQANLDACVRKGFAIHLNKKRVTAAVVLEAIDKLLHDAKAVIYCSPLTEGSFSVRIGPIERSVFYKMRSME